MVDIGFPRIDIDGSVRVGDSGSYKTRQIGFVMIRALKQSFEQFGDSSAYVQAGGRREASLKMMNGFKPGGERLTTVYKADKGAKRGVSSNRRRGWQQHHARGQ